jgi:hypothetical protein
LRDSLRTSHWLNRCISANGKQHAAS